MLRKGLFTRVISPSGTVSNRTVLLAQFYFAFNSMMCYEDCSVRVRVVISVISVLGHCMVYADDLVLLSSSTSAMRQMLVFVMSSLANFTLRSMCVNLNALYFPLDV
jgi:hypothetical protein